MKEFYFSSKFDYIVLTIAIVLAFVFKDVNIIAFGVTCAAIMVAVFAPKMMMKRKKCML